MAKRNWAGFYMIKSIFNFFKSRSQLLSGVKFIQSSGRNNQLQDLMELTNVRYIF